MESIPAAAARRRAMRVAVRLGVVMLASGAQTREVETSLRVVLGALGLPGAAVVITYSTVSVSFIAPGDAEATTAIRDVRRWQPDYNRLAGTAALVQAIGDGRADLQAAEAELERVEASAYPYPRWLGFAAPALLSMAVTILFADSVGDALATLGIGLAIQPALKRIERSQLPSFFQVVLFGTSATALLVVLLVRLGLPIQGSLVLPAACCGSCPAPPWCRGCTT